MMVVWTAMSGGNYRRAVLGAAVAGSVGLALYIGVRQYQQWTSHHQQNDPGKGDQAFEKIPLKTDEGKGGTNESATNFPSTKDCGEKDKDGTETIVPAKPVVKESQNLPKTSIPDHSPKDDPVSNEGYVMVEAKGDSKPSEGGKKIDNLKSNQESKPQQLPSTKAGGSSISSSSTPSKTEDTVPEKVTKMSVAPRSDQSSTSLPQAQKEPTRSERSVPGLSVSEEAAKPKVAAQVKAEPRDEPVKCKPSLIPLSKDKKDPSKGESSTSAHAPKVELEKSATGSTEPHRAGQSVSAKPKTITEQPPKPSVTTETARPKEPKETTTEPLKTVKYDAPKTSSVPEPTARTAASVKPVSSLEKSIDVSKPTMVVKNEPDIIILDEPNQTDTRQPSSDKGQEARRPKAEDVHEDLVQPCMAAPPQSVPAFSVVTGALERVAASGADGGPYLEAVGGDRAAISEPTSPGALSSIGDDIEIISATPSLGDSGDYVKIDQMSLSYPKRQERDTKELKSDEKQGTIGDSDVFLPSADNPSKAEAVSHALPAENKDIQ